MNNIELYLLKKKKYNKVNTVREDPPKREMILVLLRVNVGHGTYEYVTQ